MVRTSPMMKPVMPTSGKDLYPMAKHCRMNSFPSSGMAKSSLKNRPMNTAASPAPLKLRCKAMFKINNLQPDGSPKNAASKLVIKDSYLRSGVKKGGGYFQLNRHG